MIYLAWKVLGTLSRFRGGKSIPPKEILSLNLNFEHWHLYKSLLLTLISIDGHLHSPLVCLVDVRLSSLLLSTTTAFYSTYIAISMACSHVLCEGWKCWSVLKSMNQLLGWHRGGHDLYFVLRRAGITRLYDFVGITFFSHVIFEAS